MSNPKVPGTTLTNPFSDPGDGYCELLFVRHGEQAYVPGMKIGESVDPPLNDLGRRQAEAVGKRLAQEQVHAVYASPYERARDTGAAIAGHHGHDLCIVDDLREVDLLSSLPQDKAFTELFEPEEMATFFAAIDEQKTWDAWRYGEGSAAFRARITAAVREIAHAHIGERVAVACHAGVIGSLIAETLQSPLDYGIAVHHTSITTMRAADDRLVVLKVNDFDHVLEFQDAINPMNLR